MLPDPFLFLLLALACYRIARLIAIDEGPAGIFVKLRIAAGAFDYNEAGQIKTSLGRGIACPHCVGMYAAIVLVVVVLLAPQGNIRDGIMLFILLFAIAGAQSFLQTIGHSND